MFWAIGWLERAPRGEAFYAQIKRGTDFNVVPCFRDGAKPSFTTPSGT
jgi:hypothetical protein